MWKKHRSAFIAFTKEDGETKAHQIRDELLSFGIGGRKVFLFSLRSTREISEASDEVDFNLKSADAFILVYSALARKSEWVISELAAAKALGKPMFLVKNSHNIDISLPEFMANATITIIGSLARLSDHFDA